MDGLLARVAAQVALTHVFRILGQKAGPRRVGLVLGLPSTSALVLIGAGLERGRDGAIASAEAALLGLVATVALPLAYAEAVRRGRGLPRAIASAAAAYMGVAWLLGGLTTIGPIGALVLATAGAIGAWALAGSTAPTAPRRTAPSPATGSDARSARSRMLRTLVPVACLAAIEALGQAAGARWAGLLSTFPGMTLALLVTTHLEAGPAGAARLARALPPGNLGMVAFLAAVRFACPIVGLGGAIGLGYASALVTLAAVGTLIQRIGLRRAGLRSVALRSRRVRAASSRTSPPRVAVRRVPARRPIARRRPHPVQSLPAYRTAALAA